MHHRGVLALSFDLCRCGLLSRTLLSLLEYLRGLLLLKSGCFLTVGLTGLSWTEPLMDLHSALRWSKVYWLADGRIDLAASDFKVMNANSSDYVVLATLRPR